ncbi:hypothetical protein [Glycomyces harbinensis]|uniref:NACHT domain-containing protein n=1 Tax=Glycomyces harbinensis TaxID=58114 RepID=A0A1G7C425_9ACTN|nr:hypothetical protein [Glycomyces harbinensis]SDE34059.1 hypothetical protein SAMN05216270_118135 [Glycomyces harbinensis]
MKPEVWVPSLAALLSPLIPLLVARLGGRRAREESGRARPRGGRRAWWTALVAGAAAAALLVWFVPSPWRWLVLVGYLGLTAAVYALVVGRRRRRRRLSPETERFLKQGGWGTAGYPYNRDFLPDLVRVYTKNDLAGSGDAAAPTGSRRSRESAPDLPTSFERLLADPMVRHMAITGEAGTGKTSLLEFWNHDLRLREPSPDDDLSRFVPVLVAARSLVDRSSVGEALGPDGAEALSKPPGVGMTWLVMIDAFDEITDAEARSEVERVVFAAIDEIPAEGASAKFVITSRGLTDDRRRSFDTRGVTEYQLQPFTAEQLREFLIREETSARDIEDRNAAYAAAVAKVDRFLNRWEGHDEILELIRLPLLARVTATIYFQDPDLEVPARRIDIYHDAIEHWISQFCKRMHSEEERYAPALRLLHEWHGAHGGPNPPDADAAVRALLRRLARSYAESGQESVVTIARDLLGVPVWPRDRARTQALLSLLDATGLIHDVKAINPRFLHKSYAEYLAAPDLFGRGDDPEAWDELLRDPDRRIGAVFALAQKDPGRRRDLIDLLDAEGRFPQSAGWIAAEGLCVDPETGRIDEAQRDRLVAGCLRALPAVPTAAWWTLLEALAPIESARDLLVSMVEERRIADWTLLAVARIVARQDARGVDLLRRFATEDRCNLFVRASAADDLVEHERESGLRLLLQFASEESLGARLRVEAMKWLAGHRPAQAVRLLRRLAGDAAQIPEARADAVVQLAEHDRARGARLAKQFANDRYFDEDSRVTMSLCLANLHDPEGVDLLRRFANDSSFGERERVTAAVHLVGFDREAGIDLLRRFAADQVFAHSTQVNAVHWLARSEDRSDTSAMLAHAEDRSKDDSSRLAAARWVLQADPMTGRDLLERFASMTTVALKLRVGAMEDLVDFDQPKWLAALRELALDIGNDVDARIEAAACVNARTPVAGRQLLTAIAAEPELSDVQRVILCQNLIDNSDRSELGTLRRIAEDPAAAGAARVNAAATLVSYTRPGRVVVLRRLAGDPRLRDRDRAHALAYWIESDGKTDPAPLRDLAADGLREGSARVEAAQRLVALSRDDGVRLLASLSADTSLTDEDRFSAAILLTDHDREAGLAIERRLASDPGFTESVRARALLRSSALEPETGLPMLRAFAADRSLPESAAESAAYWLALRDEEAGVRLLRAHAQDTGFDDAARVEAADDLMEFDRDAALRLLEAFGTDAAFNGHARAEALRRLARHDRPVALRHLRALTEHQGEPMLLTALAAEELARFDRDRGRNLLAALAHDRDLPDMVRAYAMTGLARYERSGEAALLRRFAEEGDLGEAARLIALEALLGYDRPTGVALLRATAADTSTDDMYRVAAAGLLADDGDQEGAERYRAFAVDPSIGGVARTIAAWAQSFERKREGMAALAAVRSEADETVRCWVDIALADRDLALRESLAAAYAGLPQDSVDLLRRTAATLTDLNPRLGYRAMSRMKAIEAARAARPGPLDPDGAVGP